MPLAQQARKNTQDALAAFPGLTPYNILEKTTASFYKLKSVHIEMEAWLENPIYHIKSSFNSDLKNLDDYKTNGRVAVSLSTPGGISTSQWVQAYQIRGVPFTWDLEKREWLPEELKISSQNATKVLEYSMLRSLFTVNEGAVDPNSINFLGIEKRKGKDCFILQYNLDPKIFEHQGAVGDVSVKIWIDTAAFLPQLLRSEGKIGDMYILQIVDYSNFDSSLELSPPTFILEKVKREKDDLKAKVDSLTDAASKIRGWEAMAKRTDIEFIDRVSFGEFLRQEIDKDYTPERLEAEGVILKWLGLLPKDADYKESLINLEVSSVAALYDPKQKVILVGDWVQPVLAELVLMHEIAHAFQDKYLDLEKFQQRQDVKDNLDFAFAHQSLLEGEATAVMFEYLLKKDKKSFKDLGDIFSLIEERLFKDSQYVRENILYNVYGYGANFIQSYLKRNDWIGLNNLYKLPPTSMKEVIHPYRYVGKEKIETGAEKQDWEIKSPGGWNKVYGTNLGEFLILLSLRQFLDKELAEKTAAGWKKDQLAIYEHKKGQRLVVFFSEWDTPSDAGEFFRNYKAWVKKRYPGTSLKEGKEFVFLKTKDKEMFSCRFRDDAVRIAWVTGVDLKEFESLVKQIYANTKPNT